MEKEFEKEKISNNSTSYTHGEDNYIPYSCHYDDYTILTKNGELLQTFKITGLGSDNPSDLLLELRSRVREALCGVIDTQNISVWIHTMRRSANLVREEKTSYRIAELANEVWRQKNYWREKYVNDLYVTIIHRSIDFNFNSLTGFLKSLAFGKLKQNYKDYLNQSRDVLQSYVDFIMEKLSDFEPHKLGIYFENKEVYSENITFFNNLLHFKELKLPLPVKDISEMLALHKIATGVNTLEVVHQGEKRFAKILSLKHYQDLPQEVISRILQLPFECFVSEAVEFVPYKDIKPKFNDYNYITSISQDELVREASGITEIEEQDDSQNTSFCKRQITITIFSDRIEQLDKNVTKLAETINYIGFASALEDIDMEAVYWSQLPGNFPFIKRSQGGLTKHIASFSGLHTSPMGSKTSAWGDFITILRTSDATAYFFNFHPKNSQTGNTIIVGTKNNGKTTLQNFLVSQAMYKDPSVLYVTGNSSSKAFLRLLGGEWQDIGDEYLKGLNPFLMEDTEENRNFLYNFILNIIDTKQHQKLAKKGEDEDVEPEDLGEASKYIVEALMREKPEDRKLSKITEYFDFELNEFTQELYGYLKPWIEEGRYQELLQSTEENMDLNKSYMGLDLSELTKASFKNKNFPSRENLIPAYYENEYNNEIFRSNVIYYLLYKYISQKQDTSPTLIVLDELFELINDNCIEILQNIIDLAESKNCILLVSANGFEFEKNKDGSHLVDFYKIFDTQILMCNEDIQRQRFSDFEMSEREMEVIKSLKPLYRNFILRQNESSIQAEVNLSISQPLTEIFSNGEKHYDKLEEMINKQGGDYNKATDAFMEKLGKKHGGNE